ncbi:hypothetical protein vseg_009780 [Gypsophila vaccaria]
MGTSNNNTTEDFSFPVISNNPLTDFRLPCTTSSSSSLWRISSKVYHHSEDELDGNADDTDEEGDDYRLETRSMCEEIVMPSSVGGRELVKCSSFRGGHEDGDEDELNVEERMDFLWQNFNEEEEESRGMMMMRSGSKQVCVVQKRLSRMSRRHNTLVVIAKVLKGLVSMRKSSTVRILKPRF